MIDQQLLRELLSYDPETGVFIWRERTPDMFNEGTGRHSRERNCKRWNSQWAGVVAGTNRADGYQFICVRNRRYRGHHLAFLYVYGRLPREIDHIDHDPANNRISNLREATRSQNMANSCARREFKGVHWHKAARKWEAHITIDRRKHYLGLFESREAARDAYREAATEQFGEFAS